MGEGNPVHHRIFATKPMIAPDLTVILQSGRFLQHRYVENDSCADGPGSADIAIGVLQGFAKSGLRHGTRGR